MRGVGLPFLRLRRNWSSSRSQLRQTDESGKRQRGEVQTARMLSLELRGRLFRRIAGTTREMVDEVMEFQGSQLRFVDTAGI